MADTIKIGSLDISAFKVGSSDCKVYLGDTLLYPTTPPTPTFKWIATYTGGTTSSAECDSTSAITQNEINLTDLVSVEIGNCVTSIGERAFFVCDSLISIDIPDSVTTIGSRAFSNCFSITSVTIGSGITYISDGAFYSCPSLSSITFEATTPPTLGVSAFYGSTCQILVPAQSVDAYKAGSGWYEYASRIQALPTPTPQWVTFSNGDTIPSDLQIYGIKGIVNGLSSVFSDYTDDIIVEDESHNMYGVHIGGYYGGCYEKSGIASNTSVEYIFSNIGCSDSYTVSSKTIANMSNDIQLYIYA